METNQEITGRHRALDTQIARLLDHADEAGSIVDRLMAIPGGDAGETPEWDRAVAHRLQRKLAATVRDLIEPRADKRSA